jgi:asparagine synthase (glutamine-hydrolysing)
MCGIAGIVSFTENGKKPLDKIEASVKALRHRGPDNFHVLKLPNACLGHARLSIIDTSAASDQPFSDVTGRYKIVFNGEIFNYRELRKQLEQHGIRFSTSGDVEVLLESYKLYGPNCLEKLRGFFAFAIYDTKEDKLFVARDRFGVKPFYYYFSPDNFIFSSEVNAISATEAELKPDYDSLFLYFQLNYIPGNRSVFSNVKKLAPGCYAEVFKSKIKIEKYFDIKKETAAIQNSTQSSEQKLQDLLEESVKDRLVSDVPVGCFLSGGIDSTIIAGIAARLNPSLQTFCLGFTGNKWFDESPFAETAAEAFKTDHHTFMLSNDDLFAELYNFLDAIDEPFADSSALNVYILSKKTKPFVKTVLSGDGADEIFGGYNKHRAEWLIRNSTKHRMIAGTGAMFGFLFPKSRNSGFANSVRQLEKFSDSMKLPLMERYWKMATITDATRAQKYFSNPHDFSQADETKKLVLQYLDSESDFNKILMTDVALVLEGDMLVKVDRMSMAHGLEVRNPFLDHRVVTWGLSVPAAEKVNSKEGKLILKKTFSDIIPAELLVRKKHGFEVPLHKWMQGELKNDIENAYLNKDFIEQQGLFNYEEIAKLKTRLFSESPGDAAARAWAFIVFNHWYRKNTKYFA